MEQLGIELSYSVGNEFWQEAGTLKAVYRRISLADCFALALTREIEGVLLSADHHELDALAQQSVCQVSFIR